MERVPSGAGVTPVAGAATKGSTGSTRAASHCGALALRLPRARRLVANGWCEALRSRRRRAAGVSPDALQRAAPVLRMTAPSGSPASHVWRVMCTRDNAWAALKVSAVVGTLLNVLNNGPAWWHGEPVSVWRVLLNLVVPYLVSSYSAARHQVRANAGHAAWCPRRQD
jgi:hypothetical protein